MRPRQIRRGVRATVLATAEASDRFNEAPADSPGSVARCPEPGVSFEPLQ